MKMIKKESIALFLLDNIAWVLSIVFYLGFAFVRPVFLTWNMFYYIIYASVPIGFLVLAESICLISGNFDLSIGQMTGFIAMFVGHYLFVHPHFPIYIALIMPMLVGILCGCFNGFFIGILELNPFLITLGSFMIFEGATLMVSSFSIPGTGLPKVYLLIGKQPQILIPLFILVLIILWFILRHTEFGTHIYAVGGNPKTSRMLGIDVKRTKFWVFVMSGFFCGFSALAFTGFDYSVPITLADGTVFTAFAGAVIGGVSLTGGRGSVINTFAGILFLSIIEAGLAMFRVPGEVRTVAIGGLVIAAVVINMFRETVRDRILRPNITFSVE